MIPLGILTQQQQLEQILIFDAFTEVSDGVSLSTHVPDIDTVGTGWNIGLGTWAIYGNELRQSTTSSTIARFAFIDSGESDVVITVKGTFHDDPNYASSSIMLRYTDDDNCWLCAVKTFSTVPWTWGIYERSGGVQTERASILGSTTGAGSVTLDLKVTATNESIRYEIVEEGVDLLYESAVSNKTVTKHGLRASIQSTSGPNYNVFDNFKIISI